jgi:hypothetical protein
VVEKEREKEEEEIRAWHVSTQEAVIELHRSVGLHMEMPQAGPQVQLTAVAVHREGRTFWNDDGC